MTRARDDSPLRSANHLLVSLPPEKEVEVILAIKEYTHEGHPDCAGQYSQGTFTIAHRAVDESTDTMRGILDNIGGEFETQLLDECVAHFPDGMSRHSHEWETEWDTDDATYVEVRLTIRKDCIYEGHDDNCDCWEYVHSLAAYKEG